MPASSTVQSDRRRTGRRRLPLRVIVGAFGLIVLLSAAAFAACWWVAGQLVRPDQQPRFDLRVVAVGQGVVTLSATADSRRPGRFGLAWRSAADATVETGVLGDVVATSDDTVTRELLGPPPLPLPGDQARITVAVWMSDPGAALGLPFEEVTYDAPLGPTPAWLVPAPGATWVIQVHGHGGDRTVGLRVLPTLHELGYPVLAINYRNDAGAPRSADGQRRLGATEWQDVEAAVAYAVANGATEVILFGWSLGGGIVENYLHRARGADIVRAVVLDSPALDWRAIIAAQVRDLGLPSFIGRLQAWVLRLRTGIDVDDIDMLAANRRAGGPRRPLLLFHGSEDRLVPFSTSAAFAAEWPDSITWVPVAGAGHTQAWNVDFQRYDQALREFLAAHATD